MKDIKIIISHDKITLMNMRGEVLLWLETEKWANTDGFDLLVCSPNANKSVVAHYVAVENPMS
jgi:hypothetical protein